MHCPRPEQRSCSTSMCYHSEFQQHCYDLVRLHWWVHTDDALIEIESLVLQSPTMPWWAMQRCVRMVTHRRTVVARKVALWFGSMANALPKMDSPRRPRCRTPTQFNWSMALPCTLVKCTMIRWLLHNWHAMHPYYRRVSTKSECTSMVSWFHSINTRIQRVLCSFPCQVKHRRSLALHHNQDHLNPWFRWLALSKHRVIREISKVALKITIHWSPGRHSLRCSIHLDEIDLSI